MDRALDYTKKAERIVSLYSVLLFFLFSPFFAFTQMPARQSISLNEDWQTIANDSFINAHDGFEKEIYPLKNWKRINVPHNWDSYEGYRRLLHGNRHGYAWYRKTFKVNRKYKDKKYFLFFEGVGSYATVWLNGIKVGSHAGGRTSFTIDISEQVIEGKENLLAVRADHPAMITDLPWVCGGCSEERGFSEGSQPMGIFRPVHLLITNNIKIVPFGVHIWNDESVNDRIANFSINTTIKNYSSQSRKIRLQQKLYDKKGRQVAQKENLVVIKPYDSTTILQAGNLLKRPELWSPDNPNLYSLETSLYENDELSDRLETTYGFRSISWKDPSHRLLVNNKPVFINGIAEYEHLLGQSHAFTNEEIISRMKWITGAGFNAFRDAHQPHNLLYGKICDEKGILWWTQMSAHVWYDSTAFKENFRKLLKEWVIERRNNPSVILWGLQNESKIPEAFAKECTELIRQLDPTASKQRLVTTCNGGTGTDWDVPQNWTGTYGGDPATYGKDLKQQILVGEYGAWRTIDLHTEGNFVQNGPVSEDRICRLMEQKIMLAESVKDSVAGHFFWLLNSHDNPGRVQGGEGLRENDRVGPVNYKGLLTPWEEPVDLYYLYRANYVKGDKDPMVYINSHTWPQRWKAPGIKDSIIVYSNCEEVELFNDINALSLGKRKKGKGELKFQWDQVPIKYNVLFAVGYIDGKAVAKDTILFYHLPGAPGISKLRTNVQDIIQPTKGLNYLYRVNCGGPDYKDSFGNLWWADRPLPKNTGKPEWGSVSWTNQFDGMPAYFASQRRNYSPIKATNNWELFQTYRYGKSELQYIFPLPEGEYKVELFFVEPWIGIGGSRSAPGMRLFDVAINGTTVINNLDVWKEAGSFKAMKKTITAKSVGGKLVISFPQSSAGQAIISAIAIASGNKKIEITKPAEWVNYSPSHARLVHWLDIGDQLYGDVKQTHIRSLPPALFGADWLQRKMKDSLNEIILKPFNEADLYIGYGGDKIPIWLSEFENPGIIMESAGSFAKNYKIFRKRITANENFKIPGNADLFIALQPATHMQPAFDLKPVKAYRADVVEASSGAGKMLVNGRETIQVSENGKVEIQWPIQTGVADIYSITVKYYSESSVTIPARIQLIGAGGSMMLDEPVNFTFTRAGKWNQFTINTGNMINAGNYKVKIIVSSAKGLALSGIDIQ